MKRRLETALIGNAAALGFNWVYNMPYLTDLNKTQPLVFQPVEKHHYDAAKKAFYGYPYAKVGDVSFQGDIAFWLYQALKTNPQLTASDYLDLVYSKIQPGGSYIGYVESYGRELIYNRLTQALKKEHPLIAHHDDQMVGFAPYVACQALGLGNELAWSLTQAFTDNPLYPELYRWFDAIHEALQDHTPQAALQATLIYVPQAWKETVTFALQESDTAKVIEVINTACHIDHAVPLVMHILAHTTQFQEAIELNTRIGGASCDRGQLIGTLYGEQAEIPTAWLEALNRH